MGFELYRIVKQRKRYFLLLSLMVISIVAYQFLKAIEREAQKLEVAMFNTMLAELESVLVLKTATLIAQDRKRELKNFVNQNPMEWMKSPPVNYSQWKNSELSGAQWSELSPGNWTFDPSAQVLIYRVINPPNIVIEDLQKESVADEATFLQFKVVLDYLDHDADGQYDQKRDRLMGLKLKPILPYRWKLKL